MRQFLVHNYFTSHYYVLVHFTKNIEPGDIKTDHLGLLTTFYLPGMTYIQTFMCLPGTV